RLLGILLTVLFVIATAVLVWPQFFQLETTFPIAQIIASRALVLAGFVVIILLALLLLIARPLRGFAASILIVALIGAAATGFVGATRGLGTGSLPEKTDAALRVLTWNTNGAAVSAEQIAKVIAEQDVDIVALPETSERVGEQIAIRMRDAGEPMAVHHVNIHPAVQNGPQAM